MDCQEIRALIEKEFACEHPGQVLTYKTSSNGRLMYRWQCMKCGRGTEELKHAGLTEAEKSMAVSFDDSRPADWWDRRQKRWEQLRRENPETSWEYRRADRYNRMVAYYASLAWEAKRDAVLDRDKHTCQMCGGPASQAHHLTYERLFNEELTDLVAVCQRCHRKIHGIEDEGTGS